MTLFLMLAACGPQIVDNSVDDYLVQRPGPDAMVDADGNYVGGWWSDWTGQVNPEDTTGRDGALKGWFHFSFNADDYYIVTNLADLNDAANTALLVVDKKTGKFYNESLRYAFGANEIETSQDRDEYSNPPDGSYSRRNEDGSVDFGIFTDTLSFEGSATPRGKEFIQTTRSEDGYGWLQRYPNLEISSATLDLGAGPVQVPAGTLGLMDWTVGHRSTEQTWNWLSCNGYATAQDTGESTFVSLQIAKDQEGADPVVTALKYGAWVGDDLFKFSDIVFDYDILDEDTRETGDWHIYTPEAGDDALDLTFTPMWQRTEQVDFLWYVHTDLNQHYGTLTGSLTHDGQTYVLDGLFALVEDSLLVL